MLISRLLYLIFLYFCKSSRAIDVTFTGNKRFGVILGHGQKDGHSLCVWRTFTKKKIRQLM